MLSSSARASAGSAPASCRAFTTVPRPAHRGGRVDRHDLAGHQPVEQMADRGQALLDGRRRIARASAARSRRRRAAAARRRSTARRLSSHQARNSVDGAAHRRGACAGCGCWRRRIRGSACARARRRRRRAREAPGRRRRAGQGHAPPVVSARYSAGRRMRTSRQGFRHEQVGIAADDHRGTGREGELQHLVVLCVAVVRHALGGREEHAEGVEQREHLVAQVGFEEARQPRPRKTSSSSASIASDTATRSTAKACRTARSGTLPRPMAAPTRVEVSKTITRRAAGPGARRCRRRVPPRGSRQ